MKYTTTLKTLKEITGNYYVTDITYKTIDEEHTYRVLWEQLYGKIIYVEKYKADLYMIKSEGCYPLIIPSYFLKDIQPVKEPVDWAKVEKDAQFLGWNKKETTKTRQHFAKYENGKVYSFAYGRTSWTNNETFYVAWDNAELAEEEK